MDEPAIAMEYAPSLDRNYSNESDESPFTSQLATPTDELDHSFDNIRLPYNFDDVHMTPKASNQPVTGLGERTIRPKLSRRALNVHLFSTDLKEITGHATGDATALFAAIRPLQKAIEHSPEIQQNKDEDKSKDMHQPADDKIIGKVVNLEMPVTTAEQPTSHVLVAAQDPFPVISPLLDSELISHTDVEDMSLSAISSEFIPNAVFSLLVKIICFLPWAIFVGAAIVFSPAHLEVITFSPGFVSQFSPKGIRRHAHWSHFAVPHVFIFLTALGLLLWQAGTLEVSLVFTPAAVVQFWHVWGDFKVNKEVPLGSDDKQSVFLVVKDWVDGNAIPGIRKTNEGFFITDSTIDEDTVADAADSEFEEERG